MRIIFVEERRARAAHWPLAAWYFFWITWRHRRQCRPPMTVLECLGAARHSAHLWIWGRIELDEYLLLRGRDMIDEEGQPGHPRVPEGHAEPPLLGAEAGRHGGVQVLPGKADKGPD